MSTYKPRLTTFYEKYAPNKVAQVDAQLEKYKGQEEDLLAALVQKYGPEPEVVNTTVSASGVSMSFKDRLTAFYEKYAPNKVAQVDAQLEKYKGQEEDLLAALVQKYGPEPEGEVGTSLTPSVRSRKGSEMNGSAVTHPGTYGERLTAFYERYAPNKVAQVDAQLEKYKGREEDLLAALVQKYGPEPEVVNTTVSASGVSMSFKDRLTAFYEKYAPNKVAQVDAQLEKYKGQEEDLLAALVQKYGPEPEVVNTAVDGSVSDDLTRNEVRSETGHHSLTEDDTSTGAQRGTSETHVAEVDFLLSFVADKGRQQLLRDAAAELGVTVNSRETLLVLEALLDTRTVMAVAANSVPEADVHIHRAFNESMYAPSTVQLASTTVVTCPPEAFDFNSMNVALMAEEEKSRGVLELLAADDGGILLAAERRELRLIKLRDALHLICTEAETALRRRVWQVWCDAAVRRIRGERWARVQQMTPYQKMLFGKSVSAYYERLARSRRAQEQRGKEAAVETAHINDQRKRHLLKSINRHGDIIKRNILAVVLSDIPETRTNSKSKNNNNNNSGSWDVVASPDNSSPEITPMNYKPHRQKSNSQHISLSPSHIGETAMDKSSNNNPPFYRYGKRNERLLSIEKDFDGLPPEARARVFRTLKKWDMLPLSPPPNIDKSSTRHHHHYHRRHLQEKVGQSGHQIDEFDDVFVSGVDDDELTPMWENEEELRLYLSRVLIDALDAEKEKTLSLQQHSGLR
ncbi:uncharacterized protein TM35_000491330 [Trypanosoma theileri]|uniref:Uncharacterized protein n=1 Tax=Trypanosoma theileri TaxID=67003 RepID=A0A1X0NHJ8_9TRYP|nr:uncharacterized protein TM35_000491330 [Trypanosoma theileri]ORC84127.1 hypothetical protein TM35_000491330 [Trypanosoma theileri]